MKPNTAAHILFILPLLVSLCVAMPVQAVDQLGSQTSGSQTSGSQTSGSQTSGSQTSASQTSGSQEIAPSPIEPFIQPPRSTSFYQQQLDKLKYTPDALLRSQNSSVLRRKGNRQDMRSQNIQSQPVRPISPEISTGTDIKEAPQQLTVPDLNSRKLDATEGGETQSIKERIQQQIQTQKRNLTGSNPLSSSSYKASRRDPYAILEAAKSKHSPIQGRRLDIESFSANQITDKINSLKPNISPLKQQIPETIDQLKADFQSTIQQQPEQLQRALTAAKTDLQQRSANRLNRPLGSVKVFVQRTIKDPLGRLLKKIGIAAQATAEQLQDSK